MDIYACLHDEELLGTRIGGKKKAKKLTKMQISYIRLCLPTVVPDQCHSLHSIEKIP